MSIWKLIFYRLKIAAAGLTRGPIARRIARGLALATLGTLMVLLVMGTYVVFTALAGLGETGATAAAVVVLLAFNAVLVLALVFDILTTTGIFFLSGDLSLLMAAPIPTYKVFALKYLEAMVAASFVALLVGIPIFIGYGLAFHAPVLFYVALVVVTAVFITIPISVGTICGMVVSRFVPASRVKEALAVLSGAIGLGLWIALQVFKPTLAGPEQIQDFGTQMQALARGTAGGLLGALPSRFPAGILTSLATGRLAQALPPLLWLLAISGVMLAASVAVAQRIYLTGWTRITPSGRRTRRAKPAGRTGGARPAGALSPLWRLVPAPERSVLTTTARLFLRDAQQLMPIATLTVMIAILPFFMGRGSQFVGLKPGVILFASGALAFIGSLNLAMSAVAIDGRAFWWLLLAPRPSLRKLAGKLLVAVVFFAVLTWALLAGATAARVLGWGLAVKAAWLALWSAVLGSGLGVAIGLAFADWEWDIPKRMVKTVGRLLLVLVGGAYFVAAGFTLGVFSAGSRGAALPDVGWGRLLIAGGVSAGLALVTLVASARRMDRMEWTL